MVNLLRLLFLAGILLGSAPAARAQDAVEDSYFGVRLSSGSSWRVVETGDSKNQVIQVLGPPTKTSRYYAETEKTWATVLHYGSNKLHFTNDVLGLVELNDARFTLGKPGTKGFQVGSVRPKAGPGRAGPGRLKEPLAFGLFKVKNKPGRSYNPNYQAISYGNMKTPEGRVADVAYEILYDQQGRVMHIFLNQTYD